MSLIKKIQADALSILIFDSRKSLGEAAESAAAEKILEIAKGKAEINMVFASAPSQNEFLSAMLADKRIPWDRINAFHMDEYIGLRSEAPQGFGNFIRDRLWGKVPLKSANYIDGNAVDINAECARYAALLHANPIDIVCFGIGENGHLAFNDPSVADFYDPKAIKLVELEEACRQQQVNDGCFRRLDDVPKRALTMTMPALTAGKILIGMVPGITKAEAVYNTATGDISTGCPASILRNHPNAVLYTDTDSAAFLLNEMDSVNNGAASPVFMG